MHIICVDDVLNIIHCVTMVPVVRDDVDLRVCIIKKKPLDYLWQVIGSVKNEYKKRIK